MLDARDPKPITKEPRVSTRTRTEQPSHARGWALFLWQGWRASSAARLPFDQNGQIRRSDGGGGCTHLRWGSR